MTGSASVKGYVFRAYESLDMDNPGCVKVYRNGKVVYRLAQEDVERYELGQHGDKEEKIPYIANGTSLTGDGRSDMIVRSWSGGAHCCFTDYVFELKPKLRLIATLEDGDAGAAHFEHLPGSPAFSYVTWDIWSYWPQSFASSVSHKIVLRWDGRAFRVDLKTLQMPAPTPEQWRANLKAVDEALERYGDRGSVGLSVWDPALDLIYSGHSELAWKFAHEANPKAIGGDYPSLEEFCSMLSGDVYWRDLKPTLKDVPTECARGLSESKSTSSVVTVQ